MVLCVYRYDAPSTWAKLQGQGRNSLVIPACFFVGFIYYHIKNHPFTQSSYFFNVFPCFPESIKEHC